MVSINQIPQRTQKPSLASGTADRPGIPTVNLSLQEVYFVLQKKMILIKKVRRGELHHHMARGIHYLASRSLALLVVVE